MTEQPNLSQTRTLSERLEAEAWDTLYADVRAQTIKNVWTDEQRAAAIRHAGLLIEEEQDNMREAAFNLAQRVEYMTRLSGFFAHNPRPDLDEIERRQGALLEQSEESR